MQDDQVVWMCSFHFLDLVDVAWQQHQVFGIALMKFVRVLAQVLLVCEYLVAYVTC